MIKKILPILDWLPGYTKSDFFKDLPAGLTVGVMLIPTVMAYAMIAGLTMVSCISQYLCHQLIYAIH